MDNPLVEPVKRCPQCRCLEMRMREVEAVPTVQWRCGVCGTQQPIYDRQMEA